MTTSVILLKCARAIESGDDSISACLTLILWAKRIGKDNARINYYDDLGNVYRHLDETTHLKSLKKEFEKEIKMMAKTLSKSIIDA